MAPEKRIGKCVRGHLAGEILNGVLVFKEHDGTVSSSVLCDFLSVKLDRVL